MQNDRFVVVKDKEVRKQIRAAALIGFDPVAVGKILQVPNNFALSYLPVIGKPTKVAWTRGERLPDSYVVLTNRFPAIKA